MVSALTPGIGLHCIPVHLSLWWPPRSWAGIVAGRPHNHHHHHHLVLFSLGDLFKKSPRLRCFKSDQNEIWQSCSWSEYASNDESDFWYDVMLSRCRPWRHSFHAEKCNPLVSASSQPVLQFLIYSTFVLVSECRYLTVRNVFFWHNQSCDVTTLMRWLLHDVHLRNIKRRYSRKPDRMELMWMLCFSSSHWRRCF